MLSLRGEIPYLIDETALKVYCKAVYSNKIACGDCELRAGYGGNLRHHGILHYGHFSTLCIIAFAVNFRAEYVIHGLVRAHCSAVKRNDNGNYGLIIGFHIMDKQRSGVVTAFRVIRTDDTLYLIGVGYLTIFLKIY